MGRPQGDADPRRRVTPVELDRFRGDLTIVRSPHGIKAVRQKICVSNDVTVHVLEVDVLPGPAWAQVASESHARLSIVLEAVGGGCVESRLKRDQAPVDGPFTMNFAPPGAEVWGYSEGIRRVRDIRLDFDLARLSQAVGEQLTMPEPRVFRNDRLRSLARCLAAECEAPDRLSSLYIDSLTLAACIDFLRLGREPSERAASRLPPRQLRRVTDYVIDHLSEAVRLKELAAIIYHRSLPRSLHCPLASTDGSFTKNLNKAGVRLWERASIGATSPRRHTGYGAGS